MGQVHQKIIKMVFAVLLAPNPLFWEGTNKKKKKGERLPYKPAPMDQVFGLEFVGFCTLVMPRF